MKAFSEGDPFAIGLLVASVGGGGVVLAVLVRRARENERRFDAEVEEYGRDLSLIRRAAREHRSGSSELAMAFALTGLITAVAFLGISPWASLCAVLVCGTVVAVIRLRAGRIPEVDRHPLFLLARDDPGLVESATWFPSKHSIHLTIKTRGSKDKVTYKLNVSWGAELIERLPEIFPRSALHAVTQAGRIVTIREGAD
jgi:hypothetical protein